VTSIIPKISFAVFNLFVLQKSVFDENKVNLRTKSSRWKDFFKFIFKDKILSHFGNFWSILGAVPPAQALPVHVINLRSQVELFPAKIHPEISG